jgi:ATP-dependent helicase HrpB
MSGRVRDLPRLLGEQGLAILPWEDEADAPRKFLDRIRFFAAHSPNASSPVKAPDLVSQADSYPRTCCAGGLQGTVVDFWIDNKLLSDGETWLGPFIWEGNQKTGKGPVIDGKGLIHALESRLGWDLSRELDKQVPPNLCPPQRKKAVPKYSSGEPVLRFRLQDAFGITSVRKILGAVVIFQLLSPADRPIQTTGDLPGFWSGSYADVRKEMRGRYPKHAWPENPGRMETSE